MIRAAALVLFAAIALARAQQPAHANTDIASRPSRTLHFDPNRNAAEDIQSALAEAKRSHRRVLIDVGGDWCPYCLQMDVFFQYNKDLLAFRDEHFVFVPVYIGSTDKPPRALSAYPRVEGIPHFYVLDADGHLLHSQHVVELRESGDYSPARMSFFLQQWASRATNGANAEH